MFDRLKKFFSLSWSLLKYGAFVSLIAGVLISLPDSYRKYLRYNTSKNVVAVTNLAGNSGGTGFHVVAPSGKTYIMTNKHVCGVAYGNDMVKVKADNGEAIPRKIIARYEAHDLCLIEAMPDMEGEGLKIARWSSNIGDTVHVIGHPHLEPTTMQTGEFISIKTIELISKTNIKKEECSGKFINIKEENPFIAILTGMETICIEEFVSQQASLITYPGNSGSPVINAWGNVMGVLFAGSGDMLTNSFFVPLYAIKDFLKKY